MKAIFGLFYLKNNFNSILEYVYVSLYVLSITRIYKQILWWETEFKELDSEH